MQIDQKKKTSRKTITDSQTTQLSSTTKSRTTTTRNRQGSHYRSWNGGTDVQCQVVRPWKQLVLFPPSLHYESYVETERERHRYAFALRIAVLQDFLEHSEIEKTEHGMDIVHTRPRGGKGFRGRQRVNGGCVNLAWVCG